MLDVGDVKGDVTELVRHDAPGGVSLAGKCLALEHLQDRALRIGEGEHVGNGGIGIFLALGLDAVPVHLALERVEVVVGAELKADAHALRLRAPAQHHAVMIDGGGKIGDVLVLLGQRQAENVGVVFDLLVEIGDVVAGVGDLLDADHASLRSCLFDCTHVFARGSAAMTSTMAAPSFSPKPISMNFS